VSAGTGGPDIKHALACLALGQAMMIVGLKKP
jgi:hypothetical protein